MIGIIGAGWLAAGAGIWLWLAWRDDERDLAISILPIVVLLWPALIIAMTFDAIGRALLDEFLR